MPHFRVAIRLPNGRFDKFEVEAADELGAIKQAQATGSGPADGVWSATLIRRVASIITGCHRFAVALDGAIDGWAWVAAETINAPRIDAAGLFRRHRPRRLMAPPARERSATGPHLLSGGAAGSR